MRKLIIMMTAGAFATSAINATTIGNSVKNTVKTHLNKFVEENGMTTLKNDNALKRDCAFDRS